MKLSLTIVDSSKNQLTVRLLLENIGKNKVRVLLPSYNFHDYTTAIGGYRLVFSDSAGKPADVDFGAAPPSGIPPLPKLEDTVLLKPGTGVSLRIPLSGDAVDSSKVSTIVAQNVVHGPSMESAKETGGGTINLNLGSPPLWQGGKFVSEPLSLLRNKE